MLLRFCNCLRSVPLDRLQLGYIDGVGIGGTCCETCDLPRYLMINITD